MKCRNCDIIIEEGYRFCPQCGAVAEDEMSSSIFNNTENTVSKLSDMRDDIVSTVMSSDIEEKPDVSEQNTATPDDAEKGEPKQYDEISEKSEETEKPKARIADKPIGAKEVAQTKFEKEIDKRVQSNSHFSAFPKFVVNFYKKRVVLFTALVAVSVFIVILCITYMNRINNPITFNTYQDLQRINEEMFSFVSADLGSTRTFNVGAQVQGPFTTTVSLSSTPDPNERRYIEVSGTYVMVYGGDRHLIRRGGVGTLSVLRANPETIRTQIDRRIEALENAARTPSPATVSGFMLGTMDIPASIVDEVRNQTDSMMQQSHDSFIERVENEIVYFTNMSNNLGEIRLTVVNTEARQIFPTIAGLTFAVVGFIALLPMVRAWIFIIAPKKSGIYRKLALYGDAGELLEDFEKSFGPNAFIHNEKINTNKEFIIIRHRSHIVIAPTDEAVRGNLIETARARGRYAMWGIRYTYKLELSFAKGLHETIRMGEEGAYGESALNNIKRFNPKFMIGGTERKSGLFSIDDTNQWRPSR